MAHLVIEEQNDFVSNVGPVAPSIQSKKPALNLAALEQNIRKFKTGYFKSVPLYSQCGGALHPAIVASHSSVPTG